jgi:NAD(P)H-hydrate epimerase
MTAITYVEPSDLAGVQIRGDVSHKGHSGGKVLVIGGGGPYVGSPVHAALAALRAGADVVSVASPRRAADIIASISHDLIVWPLGDPDIITEEDVGKLRPLIEANEVVIIGMGMGPDARTQSAIKEIIPLCKKVVIDSGALMPGNPLKGIITPHHSEFRRISGLAPTADYRENAAMAREYSAKSGIVTIIKGPVDVISDGDRVKYSETGNPGMTVSGTGDVLAGIVGALYCKNPAFEAACSGAFLCGVAGDLAFEEKGFGLLASDVAGMIPYALKKYHPAYAEQMRSIRH